jgi:glyoxylase-like metal-dependent hydrolase (beta-lactamase superfamily II)
MKRGIALSGLVGIGMLSLVVSAQQPAGGQAPPPRVVEVEKVKDNLFMMKGGGGNSAVFITSTGIVVVDSKNAGWGQLLLDKIKTVSDKPITTLINTHSHGDHTSGNVEFPATVEIIAHENAKKEMETWQPVTGIATVFPNVFKDNSGRGLPKRTYKDKMSFGSGADRVDLFYFGPGHTGGDTWVVFPALRTAHAGDMFANRNLPLIDANNGGVGLSYPQTLSNAVNAMTNVDTIINGHTPTTTTINDLREFSNFNKDFVSWVEAQMKAGKTVDQAAAEYKHPDKYVGYAAPQPARVKTNVQILYDELKKKGSGT